MLGIGPPSFARRFRVQEDVKKKDRRLRTGLSYAQRLIRKRQNPSAFWLKSSSDKPMLNRTSWNT